MSLNDCDDLLALNNPLVAFTSLPRSNRTLSVPSVLSHFSDNDLLGNDVVTFPVIYFYYYCVTDHPQSVLIKSLTRS